MALALDRFIAAIPKCELHMHVEGSLEPELMFAIAQRNGVRLPFGSVEEVRRAYRFTNLQSFLDIYYAAARVLLTEQDFYDLTWAYLTRAHGQQVRHVEMFFDPQTHTERSIPFGTVVGGIHRALADARGRLGVTSRLIMCFLRHLPAEAAEATLQQALPYRDRIAAVGLDSSELGHPPEKFAAVYERARGEGFRAVAHAGEEGPPEYIWQALDRLRVSRIDHGVRCLEDPRLVERLRADAVPLTVCPLSNVKLRVVPALDRHPLKRLLDLDLRATVNSDDPAYFGGYILENLAEAQAALGLSAGDIERLTRNAFEASFLEPEEKRARLAELDRFVASSRG
jgi:adenosine deaminase